jgi:hypothetical protein
VIDLQTQQRFTAAERSESQRLTEKRTMNSCGALMAGGAPHRMVDANRWCDVGAGQAETKM